MHSEKELMKKTKAELIGMINADSNAYKASEELPALKKKTCSVADRLCFFRHIVSNKLDCSCHPLIYLPSPRKEEIEHGG